MCVKTIIWPVALAAVFSVVRTQQTSVNTNPVVSKRRQIYTAPRRTCDTQQIEHRLARLETQVTEKAENVISILQEANRRFQALDHRSEVAQQVIDGFGNELVRLADRGQQQFQSSVTNEVENDKLGTQVENLVKGVQLIVATLRGLNSDMAWIKKNFSNVVNITSTLLQENENMVSKGFLTQTLTQFLKSDSSLQNLAIRPLLKLGSIPKNCKEILDNGNSESDIYLIQPETSPKPFMVYCDMKTKNGGWAYIHNRYDGSQDFFLNWHEYKNGFGNIAGEFWLGLEYIHQMTGTQLCELLVELEDFDGAKAYAQYNTFSIGSELEGYALRVIGSYEGDAGDSLIYHAGSRFSTKDFDQDGWEEGNCAQSHEGAWWYRGCDTSNLNGKYLNGEIPETYLYHGMYWGAFKGPQYSLSRAKMMIRPRGL